MKLRTDVRLRYGIITTLGLLAVGMLTLFVTYDQLFPQTRANLDTSVIAGEVEDFATDGKTTTIDKNDYQEAFAAATAIQEQIDASFMRLMWISGGILGGIALLGGVGSYIASGRTLKPFRSLNEQVRYANAQSGEAIVLQDPTREVRDLTYSFNTMLAKLENAATTQKRFNAAVAHELKTPLAVIKTQIDVLNDLKSKDIEDYRSTLNVVESSVRKMNALIDALLDSIQVETAGLDDQVALDIVVTDVLEDLNPIAMKKQIKLNGDLPNVTRIPGNEVLVYRAIYNIVENAIKYSPENTNVDVSLKQDKNELTLTIKDQGVGIAPENIDLIFEPFYRVSSVQKTEGFGLGLAMAKSFLKMHGASITIESLPNQGSTFILKFPK